MKYRLNRDHYHRFDVMALGKLPPRSYFIPFEDREQADRVSLLEKRYASPKVRCLSGDWDFKFYPRPAELPQVLDTDAVAFDTIDVPSCWQFRGYDRPFYVNIRYQFPFAPPKIPQEEPVGRVFSTTGFDTGVKPRFITPRDEYNFVGVYRKTFDAADVSKRRILSFLGVASCLDLYVNGRFVGYSEGAHNMAEFDITDKVVSGENEIVAVVRRWCTGTYLECQDMFRSNGIFRDVLLHEMDATDLWDVSFTTERTSQGYRAAVKLWLESDTPVTVTLSGPSLCVSRRAEGGAEVSVEFDRLNVLEWTAETPVLYDLYLETATACVKMRVGFRAVKIIGDLFLLNGKKLKLRGVNHHDTTPTNGYTMTPGEIEADMALCKAYNIDTVRTSHYPPDPLLLELCAEKGIYVVDECDLETHGTVAMQVPPTYNTISHDVKWQPRYLERIAHLYHRDKNLPCVIMWSLGNESGGYQNTDATYRWLKAHSDLPVHYESAIHCRRVAYDVGSEMYPPVEQVRKVAGHARREKQLNDRPYFLCEYAHAMGVGPGGVEEYWQEIYQHDNLMGGCVWEMVDHAVLHEDGSYTYGGDHGEWEHDGNFCVDGLFYPDRQPSTGARLIRHVYRPIRVRHVEGSTYEVFNTMAFTDADRYRLEFCFDGGETVVADVALPPQCRTLVTVPGQGDSVTVAVSREGRELSREQILFRQKVLASVKLAPGLPQWLDVRDGRVILEKDGKRLVSAGQHTLLYRAATDNDADIFYRNTVAPYHRQKEQLLSTRVEQEKVRLTWQITCGTMKFVCDDVYQQCDRGILLTSTLRCVRGGGQLPRFGKAFRLDESFDWVEYYGRTGESYCDMKEHAPIGHMRCRVADMTEPNLRPQESGNRCDCSWVKVSDGETEFTFTAVEKPFELGIKPYTDAALMEMKHREDEVRTGTYVTLSAFQKGIGTGSCGPQTLPQYTYPANREYTLKFVIE